MSGFLMDEEECMGIMMKRILIFIFGLLTLAFISTVAPIASQQSKQQNQAEVPYKTLELKLENRAGFKATDSTLYYVQDKQIIALDRSTWTQKWIYESTEKWTPKLELDDTQLYALSRNGYMSAFNLVTGKKNWSKKSFSEIHEIKVRWGKPTDPNLLYNNIFMSFFIFKNHIMISQPNQYVNLNKNGILINSKSFESKGGSYTYYTKAYEDKDYYALSFLKFNNSATSPNPPIFYSFIDIFSNNYQYDNRSNIGYSNKQKHFFPADIYKFDDFFLSTTNLASNGIVSEDWYHDGTYSRYLFTLYKFDYSKDQNLNLNRQNFGFFYIDSKYRNREWCVNVWCEYTQTPKDYYFIGLMDNRLYFMTDMFDKRFAYFALNDLLKTVKNGEPSNLPLITSLEKTKNNWSNSIHYTMERPKSLLLSLKITNTPAEATDNDIYIAQSNNRYVLVSNKIEFRILREGKSIQIKFNSSVENFIPARDIILGVDDLIIFNKNSISIFKEIKK